MKTYKTQLIITLSILLIAFILLATGSSILTKSLGGMPFGNFVTWLGFIALQLTIYWGHSKFNRNKTLLAKIIKILMKLLILISIFWLFIAYALSGNVNFNFNPSPSFQGGTKASKLFWIINYTIVLAPIILASIYNVIRFIEIRKARKT